MKALSLWQPWASAIDHGHKGVETRGWSTNYRGPMLICAAKIWNAQLEREASHLAAMLDLEMPYPSDVQRCLGFRGARYRGHDGTFGDNWLPTGCALCVVQLVACIRVEQATGLSAKERALGNYTPGRFAWITTNRQRLTRPCTVTGRQGLFDVPEDIFASRLQGVA